MLFHCHSLFHVRLLFMILPIPWILPLKYPYGLPSHPLTASPPPWNPSSLATIHTTPSSKLSHILKLAHRHVCHIQETQWSSLQYNHLLLQVPNCHILHTSAVEGFSSGVATFLPKQFWSDRHSVVVPGFILSVTVKIQQLQVEYLNVYLHPSKVRSLGQSLLTHLQTPASRSHSLRILGGDFNHIQKSSTSLFQNILQELDCPLPSFAPTFRKHDGYTSCLDFFLVQSCSSLSPPSASSFTFWPSYQPVGHGIHVCKFNRPAPINPCPDDLPAAAIPSSAFYLPPSARVASPSLVPHDLLPLTRALLRLQSTTLLELKANFWAWWRQQKPSPLSPQTGAHHLHILKATSLPSLVHPGSGYYIIFRLPLKHHPRSGSPCHGPSYGPLPTSHTI